MRTWVDRLLGRLSSDLVFGRRARARPTGSSLHPGWVRDRRLQLEVDALLIEVEDEWPIGLLDGTALVAGCRVGELVLHPLAHDPAQLVAVRHLDPPPGAGVVGPFLADAETTTMLHQPVWVTVDRAMRPQVWNAENGVEIRL